MNLCCEDAWYNSPSDGNVKYLDVYNGVQSHIDLGLCVCVIWTIIHPLPCFLCLSITAHLLATALIRRFVDAVEQAWQPVQL